MTKKPRKKQQSRTPRRQSHYPTIRESEAPLPLVLTAEESAVWEEISKAVPRIPFEEAGWIGGRVADEPGMAAEIDKLIQGDLTYHSALELILLGIIEAHPFKATAARGAKNATEHRLNAVLSDLTGKKRKKGPAHRQDTEWVCTVAAFHYARQAMNFDQESDEKYIESILKRLLSSRLENKTQKEQSDAIRPYRKYFFAHKLRLLVKATWSDSEEQKTRRAHIHRILSSLRALGVAVDIESVNEQLEVPRLASTA